MLFKLCKRCKRKSFKCTVIFFTLFSLVTITFMNQSYSEQLNVLEIPEPTILWWTPGFPGYNETRHCKNGVRCEIQSNTSLNNILYHNNDSQHYLESFGAILYYASNIDFDHLPLPRKGKIWGLFHEESPRNVDELFLDEILGLFNYSSTISRYSDVPFPLQYLGSIEDVITKKYYVETKLKNEYLEEISPILYLQTDCDTPIDRNEYVKVLMNFTNIDSYGACLKNKELPVKFKVDYINNLDENDFLHFVAKYKFAIAIENGVCDDYITEKLWRAIKVGTVPIYYGSPSISDWLPNKKSAILLEDFPTPELLAEHIQKLNNDDELYEQYLEHKTKSIVSNKRLTKELHIRGYQTDIIKTLHEFECFVCEKLYQSRYHNVPQSVVDKRHYNCPKPISALNFKINLNNLWVQSWEYNIQNAMKKYKRILSLS